MDDINILLPIDEVLLRSADGYPMRSNKNQDWTPRSAVLLPSFLTEAEVLNGETSVEELLMIFARYIMDRAEGERRILWVKGR